MDLALAVFAKQIQEIEIDQSPYTESYNYNKPAIDPRPKLQLGINYDRFALLLAYSAGLTDYHTALYSDREAFTNFLRAGISYRLAYLSRSH